MKRYMNARHALPVCRAVNPAKPSARCTLPINHLGRHLSFTTRWGVECDDNDQVRRPAR